jgi:hypothetical protein
VPDKTLVLTNTITPDPIGHAIDVVFCGLFPELPEPSVVAILFVDLHAIKVP